MNEELVYRFRPGALDHIMRSRNLQTNSQLAAALGCSDEDVDRLRSGTPVTARFALRVAVMQGDSHYISGLFDQVFDRSVA